jgi:hypothetical protein
MALVIVLLITSSYYSMSNQNNRGITRGECSDKVCFAWHCAYCYFICLTVVELNPREEKDMASLEFKGKQIIRNYLLYIEW